MSADLDERIVALEVRISFQEKTIEELSLVIAQQQRGIDALSHKVELLAQQLSNGLVEKGNEPPPPHY